MGCGIFRLCFHALRRGLDGSGRRLRFCGRNLRRNLRLRFGRHTLCRAFLFRRLFLLGGFRLADFLRHAPEVEQGELHATRIIGAARFYLRLFLYWLQCRRFGTRLCFGSGNCFRHRIFLLDQMKPVPFIQSFVKLVQLDFQMFPQVLRHLPDAAPVQELVGRFPVRVCAPDQIRIG